MVRIVDSNSPLNEMNSQEGGEAKAFRMILKSSRLLLQKCSTLMTH